MKAAVERYPDFGVYKFHFKNMSEVTMFVFLGFTDLGLKIMLFGVFLAICVLTLKRNLGLVVLVVDGWLHTPTHYILIVLSHLDAC